MSNIKHVLGLELDILSTKTDNYTSNSSVMDIAWCEYSKLQEVIKTVKLSLTDVVGLSDIEAVFESEEGEEKTITGHLQTGLNLYFKEDIGDPRRLTKEQFEKVNQNLQVTVKELETIFPLLNTNPEISIKLKVNLDEGSIRYLGTLDLDTP